MVDTRTGSFVVRSRMPAPQANSASFGAGIGRAMQQMGGVGHNVAVKYIDEEDKQAQKDAVNRGMEWESQYEKMRRDKVNTDILARKGKQALGSTSEWEKMADEWYQEKLKEVGNRYESDVLKNIFNRRNSATLDTLSRFEAGEKERYYDENTVIRTQSAIDDALANYTDDTIVNQAFNSGLAAIKVNYAGRDELMGAKVKQYKSDFYKLGVLRRAEDNALSAEQYYQQHKKEISGSELTALERQLKQSTTQQFALSKADALWKSGKSESEQLAEAYQITDPEKRDATISRIRARATDDRRMLEETRKQKQVDAYNDFNSAQTAGEAQTVIDKTADMDTKKLLRQEYEVRFSGKKRESDWDGYYELKQMAADNPDAYKKVNLLQYRGGLNDTEFKELVKLQTTTSKDEAFKIRTRKQIIEQSLKSLSIKDDKKKALFFHKAEELAALENADTPQSFQNIVDRLLVQGEVVSGSWYKNDANKKIFELENAEEMAKWQPDAIPPVEEKKIIEALKRANKPVTKSEIRNLYKLKTLGEKNE